MNGLLGECTEYTSNQTQIRSNYKLNHLLFYSYHTPRLEWLPDDLLSDALGGSLVNFTCNQNNLMVRRSTSNVPHAALKLQYSYRFVSNLYFVHVAFNISI